MSNRLPPQEALGGPLYAIAAALVVLPLADFLLTVPPAELSSVEWRFTAAGLLADHTLIPLPGLALALVVAVVLKHYTVQRALVILCLTSAVLLLVVSVRFLLDAPQVVATRPTTDHEALRSASTRALVKHTLSAAVLAYLGLRARRMIPATSRPHGPRPVHVVSK